MRFGVSGAIRKQKKIGGDSIDLFLVFQVERETIMMGSICLKQFYIL